MNTRHVPTLTCPAAVAMVALGCCLTSFAVETEASSPGRCVIADQHFSASAVHSPVAGFSVHGGNWQLREGVVFAPAGPGPKLLREGLEFGDGRVGGEVLAPDRRSGNVGIIVRVSDAAEGADRFNGYEVALYADSQSLLLGRHRQNFESLRKVPCPVPVGEWIPLEVHLVGKRLEVYVAGEKRLEYLDEATPLLKGTVGLRPWQREAQYRNLWVETDGKRRPLPFAENDAGDASLVKSWRPMRRGTAFGEYAIETSAAAGSPRVQRLSFTDGDGEFGIQWRGQEEKGIPLAAGHRYDGWLFVAADEPGEVFVSLTGDDGRVLADAALSLSPGDAQVVPFSLTPQSAATAGSFGVSLRSPGTVRLARAFLQAGDWAWPETLQSERLPPVAFITRYPLSAPPAVGQDLWAAQPASPGCSIRIIEPGQPTTQAKTIFSDPTGCIYDLNVTFDAQRLLFSYRRQGETHWHIWSIRTDGSDLRQLTDGPFYDVSPCETPEGDILFVSTRRFGYTVCQPGPSSNLHRMRADGSDMHCVSMNTLSDFTPQMLPDGRVLFTRWEYIDRDLTYRQSLWTQFPDGSAYQLYFGNTVRDVGTFWQARPLPGCTERVVATFAPHHGFPHGAIGLIDRGEGPEGPRDAGFTYITKEFPSIQDSRLEWAYRDPFPLGEHSFLCSYGGRGIGRYRIYLLDTDDQHRLLYEDPVQSCYYPIALAPNRRPPQLTPRVEPGDTTSSIEETTGVFLLADVYQGLEPTIKRGQAKYLRVLEQLRKTEDLRARAFDQSPVMSYGTYYAKRCWGTTDIEDDGSAHFHAPALREIYFQVLDADGRELQRMTSGVQVMPGERVSCIGCHESRQSTPSVGSSMPQAARRPPSDLQELPWGLGGIVDFPTIVQPVLDRYCIECHSGTDPEGGYDLTGDKTRYFNMAYDNLLGRSRSYRQHDMATGEMLPEETAKGKPLVHFFWLLRTPTGVNLPLWAGSHASRLTEIIESDHFGCRVPLEDRQRIYLWIDANVPFWGDYAHDRPKSPGLRDRWTEVETGRLSPWFADDFLGVYSRRCQQCHGPVEGTTDWEGRYAWINLTTPQYSPALTAHLAKDAGGRGVSTTSDGPSVRLFDSTDDPDYRAMLQAIERGRIAIP